MTHATSVDPIALAGRLLSTRTPGLVGGLIEWIAMRRVPHPVTAWRRGRTRGRVTRKERLARRGRRGRRGGGLAHLRLLSRGGRFYAANLIDSIVKGFRPAEPDKHGGQEKLAEQAHDDNCLVHKRAIFRK